MRLSSILKSINRKVLIIMSGSTLLLILLIVGLLVLADFMEDKSVNEMEQKKMAYDMDVLNKTNRNNNRCELIYPEVIEELDLSVDPYRDINFKWTEEEVSRLWLDAEASDIDYFSEANHKLIWDILKDAP